ncbi:MAG TPA: copper resistance protein CopC, partial [Pengzhenrongella sp.]
MTSPTTGPLRLTRAFLVAVLALFAVVLVLGGPAAPASAHDALISVTPADGSTVEVAPATVELVFDQPAIALGTQIRVLGPDG